MIIGGGQAGGRGAQLLAADADRWQVTLVSRERHAPYERPPRSKGILLGTTRFETCFLWPRSDAAWTSVERRPGISVEAIERDTRTVRLSTGEHLSYDRLVVATGSSPRRLICPGSSLDNIRYLRSIEDAWAIQERFAAGKRLVVVGGGFVGLEVAACARQAKLDVTVVEASDRLLARMVPAEIAGLLAKRHAGEGVALNMRTMVERFIGNESGAVQAVELSSGEVQPCDLAVVGIGAKAETDLAVAAGLDVSAGIRVDPALCSSDPAIMACGDVASFWHPLFDQQIRFEAWQNAEDHAHVAANTIRGEPAQSCTVPWFWSDQYDLTLQIAGLPHLGSSTIRRSRADGAMILFHFGAMGRLLGATGLGKPEAIGRDMRVAQMLIAARSHPDPAALRDPAIRLRAPAKPPVSIAPSGLCPFPVMG